ncbi:EamA family transporter [Paludibacterium sp. dN 18-1]|uniref:EamA family transporter n=1 Tax=Paludibacterium denitrificans TaxID=2675226 RepID=A0A844GCJ2_9NEIS|nr:EamA family transporter [Paludibacterium denitrificans]
MTIFSPAWRPYLVSLLAALLWAGNFVVGKSARVDFPPVTLALARWLIALLVLTPFVYSGLRQKLAPLWRHKRTVLVLAFAGVSVTNTFVYIGLGHTSATNGVLMNAALLSMGDADFCRAWSVLADSAQCGRPGGFAVWCMATGWPWGRPGDQPRRWLGGGRHDVLGTLYRVCSTPVGWRQSLRFVVAVDADWPAAIAAVCTDGRRARAVASSRG